MYEAELLEATSMRVRWIDVPGGANCTADRCYVCGDCLYCYDDQACEGREWHRWVVWEHRLAEFLENHPGAAVRV